jgi:hypothetical protein
VADASPNPAFSDTRCHFFKIPLDLRDDIYDYIAWGEKTLGLHVNMEVVKEPKAHYYDEGLSRTCTQIRQQYTIRLRRRIKQLMIDHRAAVELYGWTGERLRSVGRSQTILIAEREVLKGVWVQVDVASRSVIRFSGIDDKGRGLLNWGKFASTLTFALASSTVRGYNRRFGIQEERDPPDIPTWDHGAVVGYLSLLEDAAKPTRTTGGFSFGADMQQPMPMCDSSKVRRFAGMGLVGLLGFEDVSDGPEIEKAKRKMQWQSAQRMNAGMKLMGADYF